MTDGHSTKWWNELASNEIFEKSEAWPKSTPSDQIFAWWTNGMKKISKWDSNMTLKEFIWSLVEGCKN